MASHLTVTTSSPAGNPASRGLSAPAEADDGVLGVFASMLGAANQPAGNTASADTSKEPGRDNLVNLAFGAGFGSEAGEQAEDPEAIAAVIDVAVPIQAPIGAYPVVVELVESLADLKASLEADQAIDPELLKHINAALDDLAAELDIDLAALPSLDDLKALAAAIQPDDLSVGAQLTSAVAPLAETLLAGNAELSTDPELSALAKSLGEKLAALVQSLNDGAVDADKLAALGLEADAAIDPDLAAAIAKLTNPPVTVDANAAAPVLATPELKLTEPVLTGKPADPAAEAVDATLQVTAVDSDESDPDTGGKADDGKPNEGKASTTPAIAAAAAATTLPDPQAGMQTTHQASRVDAAAAPRIIQAGYQTSQQQLNLPQLAFELVRQVNDGNTRFQMRLDPPELGRIDVRLDIDPSGQVNARLTVERAETLDLMQRDQRGLEKALQQAGLDSAKTNLEFSLKQSPFSGGQQGQDGNGRQPLFGTDGSAEAEDTPPPTINLYRGSLTASGVNIIA